MTSQRVTRPDSVFQVDRTTTVLPDDKVLHTYIRRLQTEPGVVFISNYEFPDRYTRWDLGVINPPLQLSAQGYDWNLQALTPVGAKLVGWINRWWHQGNQPEWLSVTTCSDSSTTVAQLQGTIVPDTSRHYTEKERTRRPSIMLLVRYLRDLFRGESPDDRLGWYGSFGYPLVYQFEDVMEETGTEDETGNSGVGRDIVLYLPDAVIAVDRHLETYHQYQYTFQFDDESTEGLSTDPLPITSSKPTDNDTTEPVVRYPQPGQYASQVAQLKPLFQQGEMFECVLSQTFARSWRGDPVELFTKLLTANPSPYSFCVNLGGSEFLIGASPEMFVRVTGSRVETCPISGTIARGADAVQDSAQITSLLNSKKDESELTMCVDIDRNDKSRVCRPGSVTVLAHREIERYSRLFHTVDHVEGYLRPGFDGIDAFLSHLWAVTVTGAPKRRAIQYIREHEAEPRQWYGGAVGVIGTNGNVNTGMTLRTVHLQAGVARVQAGATLLWDSVPEAEEAETVLKASAMLDLLEKLDPASPPTPEAEDPQAGGGEEGVAEVGPETPPLPVESPSLPGTGRQVLLVDYADSFIHIIASYLELLGATVTCLRHYLVDSELPLTQYSLVILSPGPGKPSDYPIKPIINRCIGLDIPILGICLGHQALWEYFGGKLSVLPEPRHGQPHQIQLVNHSRIFRGLGSDMTVGLYHSLYGRTSQIPQFLQVTATSTTDDVCMGFQHNCLPVYGLQFHLESIMSDPKLAKLVLGNIIQCW